MKTLSNSGYLCILIFFLNIYSLKSQDLHYSQFYNSSLNFNPARTGLFNGDRRALMSVRDQGNSVPVPWFTFSGSYDFKMYPKRNDKYFFGLGFNYNYDRQGNSRLTLNNLNLALSFSRIINQNNIFSVGAIVGFSTRGFSTETLTWDIQWTGSDVNLLLGSGETFSADRVSFLETGLGLNYRYQKSERTKLDLGVGLYHIVEPKTTFYDSDNTTLPMRFNLSAVGSLKLISELDIQLHVLSQAQTIYNELLFGGLLKIHVNQKRGKETELHIGANYRTTRYVAPTIALRYKQIYVGASYDIDLSEFNNANQGLGGPEVHFRYLITTVKPLKLFKACPVF